MAPPLAESQRVRIAHMNASKVSFTANQMAKVADCSSRTIYGRRSKKRRRAASNLIGRLRSVTPRMLDALCTHLWDIPGLYLEEMVLFLWNIFRVLVTTYSVGRALKSIGWSKKTIRRVAQGRNADLRDWHMHSTVDVHSWQFVFVDELGCDKRAGLRRAV